jgi:enoyl-CoA hydratase/3-hydroxyacyl-CoA dehydrogenase
MNALNESVMKQLRELFHASTEDPSVVGIVIAATGKAFVAGADIRFFVRNIDAKRLDRIIEFTRAGQELLRAVQRCPKPVVARVHGLALGGGVELALACHHIVATPKASFAFPETGIGIYPGLGGTQRTPRRVGAGLAKWLILTGQTIGADEALAIGLIDRVVPFERLDAAVRECISAGRPLERRRPTVPPTHRRLAEFFDRDDITAAHGEAVADARIESAMKKLKSKAPIAVRIASELIDRGAELPIDRAVELELGRLAEIFSTTDAYEGLTSLGRRTPAFTGA